MKFVKVLTLFLRSKISQFRRNIYNFLIRTIRKPLNVWPSPKGKDGKKAQLFIFSFVNLVSHKAQTTSQSSLFTPPFNFPAYTSLYKPSYKIMGEIAWSNNSIILMLFIFLLLEESSFSSSNFSLNLLKSVTFFSHEDPPNLLLIRHSL